MNCIGKGIIVQLDDGWHILSLLQNQMAQIVIWMGCLNRKKWKLIHITMRINFQWQAVLSGTACFCISWKKSVHRDIPPIGAGKIIRYIV